RLIADDFRAAFEEVDIVAAPVSPTVAWDLGERVDDPVRNYLADAFTLPASLAGLPGLSMPAGFGEGGRPVGMQLIGRWFDAARLADGVRLRRGRPARGRAAPRPLVRRGAPAGRRRPLPAGHRLAPAASGSVRMNSTSPRSAASVARPANPPTGAPGRARALLACLALAVLAGCGIVGDRSGVGRGATPIADQRIELAGRCSQQDVDGFGENAVLDVTNNQVTALRWTIRVGKRGTCTFNGDDFRQVKSRPHIELLARDGSGCKLMVWQDPRRV